MKAGFYLVIEGVDFSGKSSLATELVKRLINEFGEDGVVHRREPSYERYGKLMRDTLFSSTMTEEKEILAAQYMLLDRIDNNSIVSGLLRENKIIIQERNFLTALVYNEAGATNEVKFVQEVNKVSLRPDHLVLITVADETIKTRLEKAKEERGQLDKYETLDLVLKRKNDYFEFKEYLDEILSNDTKEDFENNIKSLIKTIKKNIQG